MKVRLNNVDHIAIPQILKTTKFVNLWLNKVIDVDMKWFYQFSYSVDTQILFYPIMFFYKVVGYGKCGPQRQVIFAYGVEWRE